MVRKIIFKIPDAPYAMKPHRTKEEMAVLRASILNMVMGGDFTVKEITITLGITHGRASAILREFGYGSMMVSDGERTEIIARRESGKWRKAI